MPQHFLHVAQSRNGKPGRLEQPKNEASVPTPERRKPLGRRLFISLRLQPDLITGEEKGHNFEFCAKVADFDPC